MKKLLLAFLGFLAGSWLVDQYIIATREPFDPDNCRDYLESEGVTYTTATYQGKPIVTKGEAGSSVTWTWIPKDK
jgi:hypothetical protein